MRLLCATVLIFEAIVIALAIPVAITIEHEPRLWAEPIEISDAGAGVTQVFARYVEIETAARQIAKLVPQPILVG